MEIICMTGMFLYLSFEDIKKKTVPVIPIMIWGIAGVVMHLYYGRISPVSMVAGLIPGAAAYLLSMVSGEKIGRGDALLIMVTGIFMGFWGNVFMLWFGLILAALGGVVAVTMFKKGKGYELPFVPFLFAGFLIMIMGYGGMPT